MKIILVPFNSFHLSTSLQEFLITGGFMELQQLKAATSVLAVQAFGPGTTANHFHQAQSFIPVCDQYHLSFINSAISTMCYYITHLSSKFTSAKCVWNYVSRVRFLHMQLGLASEALDSFPVSSLLRTVDLTMRTLPRLLPILPHLLTQLCHLLSSLGSLGPPP